MFIDPFFSIPMPSGTIKMSFFVYIERDNKFIWKNKNVIYIKICNVENNLFLSLWSSIFHDYEETVKIRGPF